MSVGDSREMFRGSGFWSKRSTCQKNGIIISTLVVFAAIVIIACLFLIKSPSPSTCVSSVCQNEALKLRANMKTSANPCHDFFDFACGNYEETHQLPPEKSRLATFDSVADNVLDRLKLLYAKPAEEQRVQSLKFITQFYQQCNRSSDDISSLREMLGRMGGWPVANIPSSSTRVSDWESALIVVVAEFGEHVLVSITVAPNPYDTTNYALTVNTLVFL